MIAYGSLPMVTIPVPYAAQLGAVQPAAQVQTAMQKLYEGTIFTYYS
jgi:hypothetical protein